LIGCDLGVNGSELHKLSFISERLYQSKAIKSLFGTLDIVIAHLARRLVEVGMKEGLVTSETAIGITGRAGITGNKPSLILEEIAKLGIYDEPNRNVVFVDDGLARGAAVMARCMNPIGTPKNPLGGLRHGKCILKQRMDYESKSGQPPISQGIRLREKPQENYRGSQP
jgi:hypothetical protein